MKKKPPIEPEANNQLPRLVLTNEQKEKILAGLPDAARTALDDIIKNGLSGALGFPGGGGIGWPGNPFTEQLSDPTTLFKNLRWFFVSNFWQLLSEAYVEIGLIQTIVRVPVDDALRGGIEIKSKQLSEEQIQELQISVDRDDDLNTVAHAGYWNRLYGGAGILILTDQDPMMPLSLDLIGPDTPLEFRAVDMWELFWDTQNTEGYDPQIMQEDFDYYNYYAIRLHRSRVMRMKGQLAPAFLRPRLRGWGFSVVEALVRSINQYLKATDLGFQVLDEFKLDVFKIKNLVNTLLSPNGEQLVRQRIQLANWQKNYQNALVMDAEDDFGQKQLSFAGLADTMAGIRTQIASDMRIPESKLFGSKSSGLNNDDETDLEVYNAMVESEIRSKIEYDILRILEIKCQKLFSLVPDDLEITFKPLRVLSAKDEQEVKTQKFNRAHTAFTAGAITIDEYRDNINRGELLEIQLQPNKFLLNPDQGNVVEEGAVPEGERESTDDPGANREDTRYPRAWDTDAKKTENSIQRWSMWEKAVRFGNSAEFDRASYEADGGEEWIDSRREPFFSNPGNVDERLWAKAKDASLKAFGKENWKFITWWYKKQGGKFN